MIAVCPGSFDPITMGHFDIISRASALFEKVYVVVLVNPHKEPLFSAQERVELIKRSIAVLENVEVCSFNGLLIDFAQKVDAGVIVKGLRVVSDYEYEFQMALANRRLAPAVETVFLTTSAENMFLSSSVVKQIADFGGDITGFVPTAVRDDITAKIAQQKESRV